MARSYEFRIGAADAGARLDRFLVQYLPQTLSRVAIQRAIAASAVLVDGKPAKANRRVKADQLVVANFDELPAPAGDIPLEPEAIPIEVVYEDDQMLVVNKPAGLVTHPAPGHWTGTLVNAVLWHLRQHHEGDAHLPRAGIVHRLDKDTSGLLVIAKTELALRQLGRQLKGRTMSRTYLALAQGHLPFDEGKIEAAIGRHATDRKVMAIRHLGGRHAVTHYRVLGRYKRASGLAYSVVELSLETGRTHQIRVHLAHLGYPVLGDLVYSRQGVGFWQPLGITRQLLHAYALRLIHPTTEQLLTLRSSIPADLKAWIPDEVIERVQEPNTRRPRASGA